MFVLKTKEEPNPPSNHSFDPPFVHPHFFTGLTWERKVQMFEWMRGEVQGGGTHNSTEGIVKEQHVRFRQISPFLPDYAQTNVNCFKRFGFIKTNRLHDDRQMPVKFQITQRCRQRRRCRRSRRRWRRRPGTSGKTFSGTEAGRSSFGWTGLLKNWECLYKKYESPMEGKSKEGFSMAGQTFFGPCRQIDLVKKHWLCVLISHRVYIVYKPV